MNKFFYFFILLVSSINAHAFSISSTRFIVTDDHARTAVGITNGTQQAIAVQVWLDNYPAKYFNDAATAKKYQASGKGVSLAPGFLKINKNSEQKLYLYKLDSLSLPKDRESILAMYIRRLPTEEISGNAMFVAQQVILKVFYRPSGIKEERVDAEKNITPICKNKVLFLNNPTPFIFSAIKVYNDKKEHVISQLLTQGLNKINQATCQGNITLSTLNDIGAEVKYKLGKTK